MSEKFSLVLVTTPSKKSSSLSRVILKSRLAACVNVVSGVKSHYLWKGKIASASEHLLVIKTRKSLLKKLSSLIKKSHPYTIPEIIAFDMTFGNKPYLDWISQETKA